MTSDLFTDWNWRQVKRLGRALQVKFNMTGNTLNVPRQLQCSPLSSSLERKVRLFDSNPDHLRCYCSVFGYSMTLVINLNDALRWLWVVYFQSVLSVWVWQSGWKRLLASPAKCRQWSTVYVLKVRSVFDSEICFRLF